MKKPNFFIIGAPKCGTTSLAAWLAEHPQVYMSSVKEPHYFNRDQAYIRTKNLKEYESLFKKAKDEHKAVGEASVYYAYSKKAIPLIEEYTIRPKFILCIRNPYNMLVSLHRQQVFAGYEDELDFSEAWRSHRARITDAALPLRCPDSIHIDYEKSCRLGTLIEQLMTVVPKGRLMIVVLEDMSENPEREYYRVCDYLGVERIKPESFSVKNKAKEKVNPWLHDVLRKLGVIKKYIGIKHGFGILNKVASLNTRKPNKGKIENDVMEEMANIFNPEIDKISALLGRDFSSWKR